MNLLLYFCVPLVVTGQIVGGSRRPSELPNVENVEDPQTEETGLYSEHEYGSHVGYKNAIDDFAVGEHGLYYRKNPPTEDSGEIGKPNIYSAGGGDNDHPSFIVSNIYSSIRDKKNNNGQGGKTAAAGPGPSPLAYGAPAAVTIPPSPLAYGVPAQDSAIVINGHQHEKGHHVIAPGHVQTQLLHNVHHAPLVSAKYHQQVLLQNPYTGQLIQAPLHHNIHNGLVPLYPSQVAPQVTYVGDGSVISQQIPVHQHHHHHPQQVLQHALKTSEVPVYHQQLVGKAVAPVHEEVLVKPAGAPVYQAPLLKTGIAAAAYHAHAAHAHHHQQEHLHAASPLLKTEVPAHYHQQLGHTPDEPVYKTDAGLVYQNPILQSTVPVHPTPLLKPGTAMHLYQHPSLLKTADGSLQQVPLSLVRTAGLPTLLKSHDGTLYQTIVPYTKAAAAGPLILKSQLAQLYQGPPAVVHSEPQAVIKDAAVPLYYKQPVLNDATAHAFLKESAGLHAHPVHHEHAIKTTQPLVYQHYLKSANGQVLKIPLLKSPGVEAAIYPAIEETLPAFHHHSVPAAPVIAPLVKQPVITPFLPSDAALVSPHYPNVVLQKAILEKSPVLTEKAVLKAALSPVYKSPHGAHQAIIKAPLLKQYVHHGYLEPDLPAKILSSQKSLVNALISSDSVKLRGAKAVQLRSGPSKLEVVPSLSYAYSFSQYPRSDGHYGPPQPNHIKK